jgi:hypothetical protein
LSEASRGRGEEHAGIEPRRAGGARRKDVLLVDGDSQETTMTWAAARGDRENVSTDRVTTVALVGKGGAKNCAG